MSAGARLPVLTLLLLAANLAAGYLLLWQPGLVDQFGFVSDHPRALTVFTCLFLHENVLHLLGNMVFLAAVGSSVELATGAARFAVVYFAGGVGGVLLHFLLTRDSDPAPLIGASGCIAACAGYYVARYARLRVPMGPNMSATIPAVALLWVALQVAGGLLKVGERASSSAYWAHIGGFAVGIGLNFIFRAPDLAQERLDREVLDALHGRSAAAGAAAARRFLKRHPRDAGALRRLAEALEAMGERDELAGTLLRLSDLAGAEERAALLERVCALGGASRLGAARRMSLAAEYVAERPGLALTLFRSVVADGDEGLRAEALFAVAAACAATDVEASKAAARRLVEEFGSSPAAVRARARGLV